MWPAWTAHLVAVVVAFGAGFGVSWSWQGARSESALASLRSDYEARAEAGRAEAQKAREAENEKAAAEREAYRAAIAELVEDFGRRPPRTVTVRVCDDELPAGGPGDHPPGGAGGAPGATPDPGGVAGAVRPGHRTVELPGLDVAERRAVEVSLRLERLQAVCGGKSGA